MKILLLTQVLPYPLDSGPKIKTYHVLKYLSQIHEVVLVSFTRGDQSRHIQELKKICREVYTVPIERNIVADLIALGKSLLTRQPWLILRDRKKEMIELLGEVTSSYPFDAVHADQLNMAQYAQRVAAGIKVLDEHNALWLLYKRLSEKMPFGLQRWLFSREWKLLRNYEGEICREFSHVLAVSDEDRLALSEVIQSEKHIEVIPIAIDTSVITPVERAKDANHILHIGTMFWPPNIEGIIWFIREIYPMIVARRPDVIFDVVGARPPKEIIDLSREYPGIHVTGYVEDPEPYFRTTGAMVVPLRAGGGMRVKILNAMAQGLPLVSTTIGCEGIKVRDREHLLIADSPADFANAVLELLENPELASRLAENAQRLARDVYDYRWASKPLEKIYPA